jgi:hypothetical protein
MSFSSFSNIYGWFHGGWGKRENDTHTNTSVYVNARFNRGFVDDITMDGVDWVWFGDLIRRTNPITMVTLTEPPDFETDNYERFYFPGDPTNRHFHDVELDRGPRAANSDWMIAMRLRWPGIEFKQFHETIPNSNDGNPVIAGRNLVIGYRDLATNGQPIRPGQRLVTNADGRFAIYTHGPTFTVGVIERVDVINLQIHIRLT